MIPPFITLATKTRQLNLYEFTRLNTPVYAGQSSLHSPSSWMHPHFIRGNIDGLCQIKRVEVKSASFTYGDQVSGNHISTIPSPIVARTAKHRISRRATLTTELSTFIPTSIPRRATLPTELPSFVQYNHINMQSTDIAQQALPMLAHTLARASPSELSSSMHSSISSKSTPYEPSYITQNYMENEPYYTENDMKLCLLDMLSDDFLDD